MSGFNPVASAKHCANREKAQTQPEFLKLCFKSHCHSGWIPFGGPSIDFVVNRPRCRGGAALARAASGARAIARSVRLLPRTETLALHSCQLSVAHRGPRTERCAVRTLFRLLRS